MSPRCYIPGFFVLMLDVPVNTFSIFQTEPPLPGYYQYFSGSKCVFSQGHNRAEVGIEPPTSRSRVRDSTTRPPHSPVFLEISLLVPEIFEGFYHILACLGSCDSDATNKLLLSFPSTHGGSTQNLTDLPSGFRNALTLLTDEYGRTTEHRYTITSLRDSGELIMWGTVFTIIPLWELFSKF